MDFQIGCQTIRFDDCQFEKIMTALEHGIVHDDGYVKSVFTTAYNRLGDAIIYFNDSSIYDNEMRSLLLRTRDELDKLSKLMFK